MVNGSGSLLQDDSKAAVPKGGNATKVLMMVQALLATQLEGCDSAGTGGEHNLLSYLIEVIYFVGYTFSLVGDGYLYVLFGVVAVTVVFYLLVGTTWRLTFVLENRSSSTGLGPGYAGRSSDTARTRPTTSRTQPTTSRTQPTTSRTQPTTQRTQPTTSRTQSTTSKTQPVRQRTSQAASSSSAPSSSTPRPTAPTASSTASSSSTPATSTAFASTTPTPSPTTRTPLEQARPTPVAVEDRPPVRAGRRALTDDELNTEVWLASSRGYAFHRRGCRNYRGSARTFRAVRMREALAMGKQPCQCCYFDVHRAMHGS